MSTRDAVLRISDACHSSNVKPQSTAIWQGSSARARSLSMGLVLDHGRAGLGGDCVAFVGFDLAKFGGDLRGNFRVWPQYPEQGFAEPQVAGRQCDVLVNDLAPSDQLPDQLRRQFQIGQ